jgi:BirA family biotin operon repressor/biotin-[acetyl-CoA-carboxylase] ligase
VTEQAAIWRLERFESLGSTSDLCREKARNGEPAYYAVLAGWQTAGRGSRGREWLSQPGNLFLSMLLRPGHPAREAGMWALLAGVAVAQSLPDTGIALKWPNDILRDGQKLGGILIETEASPSGNLEWLVIGIGLNLKAAPVIPGRHVTSLKTQVDPAILAATMMRHVAALQARQRREGWECIRAAWRRHALPEGAPMMLRQHGQMISGLYAGLADDGALMMMIDGRLKSFSSGEIWSPTEASETMPC